MGEAQRKQDVHVRLQRALKRLTSDQNSDDQGFTGFSLSFLEEVKTPERAMRLCEDAMRLLSEDYVSYLCQFFDSHDPDEQLSLLDQAEAIWERESAIIEYFDEEKQETVFLQNTRRQILSVLITKLEEASEECKKDPSQSRILLCISILAIQDRIYHELGFPITSKQRERCRTLARAFHV